MEVSPQNAIVGPIAITMMTTAMSAAIAIIVLSGCSELVGADFDNLHGRPSSSASTASDPDAGSSGDPGSSSRANETTSSGASSSGTTSGGDGGTSTKHCSGKALACSDLDTSVLCAAQITCAWTTPKCTGLATGCATSDPNVCYARRPACNFDFDSRECYPVTGWCPSAADIAECGSQTGCSWTGGCSGTVKKCDELSIADCTKQRGCGVSD